MYPMILKMSTTKIKQSVISYIKFSAMLNILLTALVNAGMKIWLKKIFIEKLISHIDNSEGYV